MIDAKSEAPAKNLVHITVCICTYKRPYLLERLLGKLSNQITGRMYSFSVVVVDNDSEESARNVTDSFKRKKITDIRYIPEPIKNIAAARNRAAESARGEYIAFIDDDEYQEDKWKLKKKKKKKKSEGFSH